MYSNGELSGSPLMGKWDFYTEVYLLNETSTNQAYASSLLYS